MKRSRLLENIAALIASPSFMVSQIGRLCDDPSLFNKSLVPTQQCLQDQWEGQGEEKCLSCAARHQPNRKGVYPLGQCHSDNGVDDVVMCLCVGFYPVVRTFTLRSCTTTISVFAGRFETTVWILCTSHSETMALTFSLYAPLH